MSSVGAYNYGWKIFTRKQQGNERKSACRGAACESLLRAVRLLRTSHPFGMPGIEKLYATKRRGCQPDRQHTPLWSLLHADKVQGDIYVCVYISVPGGAKELSRDFLSICLKRSGASVQVLTSEWTAGAGVPASTRHWHLQVYTCMWERALCENDWTWCAISYLLLTLMVGFIDGWPRCFPRKYCLG